MANVPFYRVYDLLKIFCEAEITKNYNFIMFIICGEVRQQGVNFLWLVSMKCHGDSEQLTLKRCMQSCRESTVQVERQINKQKAL